MSGKVPEEKGKADESSTVRSECESYSPRSDDEEVRSNRMAGHEGDPVTISGVAQTSVPVVNVERMTGLDDADELLIKIVTYRTHSPLSTIFELLENERLDVLHSNTFFSGDKVFHHIQVKVLMPSRLQPGVLRQRLFALASS